MSGMQVLGNRHWKLVVVLRVVGFVVGFVVRYPTGLPLFGPHTTDATFLRGARFEPGGWWASLPFAARAFVRLLPFGLWWGATTHPTATVVASVGLLFALVWWGWRQWLAWRHEVNVLRPVFPAVAGIIGVPVTDPPGAWLDIPDDMTDDDAEIVVGLREAEADDERRVDQLVTLFDQRFGGPHIGAIDYARRLVHVRLRPSEPDIWPAVARIIGVRPSEPAAMWLEMPGDLYAADATIRVHLPADLTTDAELSGQLVKLANQRLGAGEWRSRVDHAERVVTCTKVPEAPRKVGYFEYPDLPELADTQFPIGLDWESRWIVCDFEKMESPHTLVTGGSGSGKTTFLAMTAAHAAARGAIVIILDPKWRFRRIFGNRLPNIIIADDVKEWTRWTIWAQSEMERRLRLDNVPADELEEMTPEQRPDLTNRAQFPTILLIADEFGTLMMEAQQDWRSDGNQGDALIKEEWLKLLWRGREARVYLITAAHQASANTMPQGTEGRQLYGNRFAMGTDVEVESWRMLAGPGRERPGIPARIGAGVYLHGPSMTRCQVAGIQWKAGVNEALPLARQGATVLAERGLLDEAGRLVLPGLRTSRPADTGLPVADTATPVRAAAETGEGVEQHADEADGGGGQVHDVTGRIPEQATGDELELIVGLQRAAEYLGYSVDQFRKARERAATAGAPIPETTVGTQPAWDPWELRAWHRTRPIAGKKPTGKKREA